VSDDRSETDNLLDLLYPDGHDPARLVQLRRSLDADPQARERLHGYEEVRRLVAELPVPEPERAVHYEILRQARAVAAEASGRRAPGGLFAWLGDLQLGPALAGALGLFLAVGGSLMLSREGDHETATPVSASAPSPTSPAAQVALPQVALPQGAVPQGAVPQGAVPKEEAPAEDAQATAEMNTRAPDAPARALTEGVAEKVSARSTNARGGVDFADRKADKDAANGLNLLKTAKMEADPFPSGGGGGERKTGTFAPPPEGAASTNQPPVDTGDGYIGGVVQRSEVASKYGAAERPDARRDDGPPGAGTVPQAEQRPESTRPPAQRPADGHSPRAAPAESMVDDLDEKVSSVAQPAQAPAPSPRRKAASSPAPGPTQSTSPDQKPKPASNGADSALDEEAKRKDRVQVADPRDPLALARVARKVQQWRVAVGHYQDYLDRLPEAKWIPAVLFETADAYERAGDTRRALELFRLVARSGGPQALPAEKRIAALEAARSRQAAPASDEFEAEPAGPAERR